MLRIKSYAHVVGLIELARCRASGLTVTYLMYVHGSYSMGLHLLHVSAQSCAEKMFTVMKKRPRLTLDMMVREERLPLRRTVNTVMKN